MVPTRLLLALSTLTAIALLSGCGDDRGASGGGDAPPAALSPKDVIAGKFPSDFRLGAPVSESIWRSVDASRSEEVPNAYSHYYDGHFPGLYFLIAAGHGDGTSSVGKAQIIQAVYSNEDQLDLATFAQQAGLIPGPAVAFIQIPIIRDHERMSSSSTADMRDPAIVISTDHPRVFLLMRGDGVDSVLLCSDINAIDLIEGQSLAAATVALRSAVAAGDLDAIAATHFETYLGMPHGEAIDAEWESHKARIAELTQARDERLAREAAANEARDAELRPQADARLADLRDKLAAASNDAAFELWCSGYDDLHAITAPMHAAWAGWTVYNDVLAAVAAKFAPAQPVTARDLVMINLRDARDAKPDNPNDAKPAPTSTTVRAAFAAAKTCDTAPTYADAQAAWWGLDVRGDYRFGQSLMAAGARREAATLTAAHRPEAAAYLLYVADQLKGGYQLTSGPWQPNPNEVATFAEKLDRLPHDLASIPDGLHAIQSQFDWQNQETAFEAPYLVRRTTVLADDIEHGGDDLRDRGLIGLAAITCLKAMAFREYYGGATIPAHTLDQDAGEDPRRRALTMLAPLLEKVWPQPDLSTQYGPRLAELLAEGPRLEWPVVRWLHLVVEPQEVAADDTGLHLHARGDSAGGDAIHLVLAPGPQPGTAMTDWSLFYSGYGLSQETIDESHALAAESKWIDGRKAERKALGDRIEAANAELEASAKVLQDLRSKAEMGDQEAAAEFHRRVDIHNAKVEKNKADVAAFNAEANADKPRMDAYNKRVQPFNEKVMQERSGARQKLDARLDAALNEWFAARMQEREAELREQFKSNPAERDQELAAERWLIGAGPAPADAAGIVITPTTAENILRCNAIERRLESTPAFAERAVMIVAWWRNSTWMDPTQREEFARGHVRSYVMHANAAVVRDAINANHDLAQYDRDKLETWIQEAEKDMAK